MGSPLASAWQDVRLVDERTPRSWPAVHTMASTEALDAFESRVRDAIDSTLDGGALDADKNTNAL